MIISLVYLSKFKILHFEKEREEKKKKRKKKKRRLLRRAPSVAVKHSGQIVGCSGVQKIVPRCHLKQTNPCHFVLTLHLHYLSRSSCSWLKNTCRLPFALQKKKKKKNTPKVCSKRDCYLLFSFRHAPTQVADHKCSVLLAPHHSDTLSVTLSELFRSRSHGKRERD